MPSILQSEKYSATKVSKITDTHVSTVWRWILHGVDGRKLRSVKIGGRRYVLAEDLEAFLADGTDTDETDASRPSREAQQAATELERAGF